jgi:hypothetical protein
MTCNKPTEEIIDDILTMLEDTGGSLLIARRGDRNGEVTYLASEAEIYKLHEFGGTLREAVNELREALVIRLEHQIGEIQEKLAKLGV